MLIAIAGEARAGKDTVANYLVKAHNYSKVAFAEPIKRMAKALVPEIDSFGKDELIPFLCSDGHKVSPRIIWQTLGTEWGRELINEEIWLRTAERKIGQNTVISDLRFTNESYWVRAKGGVVWHVIKKDKEQVNSHVSEAGVEILPEDVVLYNNGNFTDLYDKIEEAYGEAVKNSVTNRSIP